MTNIFAVVGEHRERPERLLLLGADGHYYTYVTPQGPPVEVEPTEEWAIDADTPLTPRPVLGGRPPLRRRGGALSLMRNLVVD
jgi:hypothetical protein